MRRKDSLSVYLEPEHAAALRDLSARTRVPMNVYIREAISRLLERYAAEAARPSMEAE